MSNSNKHVEAGFPQQPQQPNLQDIGQQYQASLYAQCAQGRHQPKTKYGVCGIITAIACFPCGLICLFIDSEKVCRQCGVLIK